MSIPNETIEQVAAANDIVEVIGSYFPLKRAGSAYRALCPFHQEKTPSFQVNPSRQIFKCFGCGAGGSVFRFVEMYEHVSFPDAVKKLAARVGIPVIEEGTFGGRDDRQQELRRVLLKLHAEAAEWFHENLLKAKEAAGARDYLKKRGIDRRIAENWQIGYAPNEWDGFGKSARELGYSQKELIASGLVTVREGDETGSYDRFRGRIMFPICNDVGEVIAFSGRVLEADAQAAKYVNSPETPLFKKGNVLFGLHKTKRALIEANSAIVCEGQLDLISVFESGIQNAVAPQGTAFTPQQARLLKRYVGEVVLCFDADTAGQKAAERSLEALLQNDLVVRLAEMPSGEDPDSLLRKHGREEFEQRVSNARDFFEVWLDRETGASDLDSLGQKMQLARRLGETVARIHDPMMRSEVANRVSARIGVPAREFEKLLAPARRNVSAHGESEEAQPAPVEPPGHEVAMLCMLALRDSAARTWLLEQNWEEVLAETANSGLLRKILGTGIDPEQPATLNRFMSALSAPEEALVSEWLMRKMPPNAAKVAHDWWIGLRQATLRRQLQIAEGRMKIPKLAPGEVTALQKQILDLREQLRDFAQLSSARVLDA